MTRKNKQYRIIIIGEKNKKRENEEENIWKKGKEKEFRLQYQ